MHSEYTEFQFPYANMSESRATIIPGSNENILILLSAHPASCDQLCEAGDNNKFRGWLGILGAC